MGGMNSKNKGLQCPKDYNQERFNKILKIFDEIDSSGNQVIDISELTKYSGNYTQEIINQLDIENTEILQKCDNESAQLEASNKIWIQKENAKFDASNKQLEDSDKQAIDKLDQEYQHKLNEIKKTKSVKYEKIIKNKEDNILNIKEEYQHKLNIINTKMNIINSNHEYQTNIESNPEFATKEYINKITGGKNVESIDFWEFFNFTKDSDLTIFNK